MHVPVEQDLLLRVLQESDVDRLINRYISGTLTTPSLDEKLLRPVIRVKCTFLGAMHVRCTGSVFWPCAHARSARFLLLRITAKK